MNEKIYAVTPRGVQLHAGDLRTFTQGVRLGLCPLYSDKFLPAWQ